MPADIEALRAAADWQISNATVYLLNDRGTNAYTIHVQRGEGTTDADAEAVAQRVCTALRDRDRLLRVAEAARQQRHATKHETVFDQNIATRRLDAALAALDAKDQSDALR